MYQDDSPMQRVLRSLSASFRIGTFFGVEVRMFWLALVITPIVSASWTWTQPGVSTIESLALTAIITGGLFLVIWVHEMGHVLAGRRYGVWTPLITVSPMGGLAHMQSAAPSPRAEMVISAAGPATHLVWLAVLWPLSLAFEPAYFTTYGWFYEPGSFTIRYLLWLNVGLAVFNLLPFFPMDGGRVLRSVLALRMHPNRASLLAARVGMFGAVLMAVASFFPFAEGFSGGILLAIALTNFMACRQEIIAARWTEGPYGEPREPWESDPEAWKFGAAADESESGPRPHRGWFGRRKRAEPLGPDRGIPSSAEVDRLLERVSQVGLSGLTAAERATLLRASAARKSRF